MKLVAERENDAVLAIRCYLDVPPGGQYIEHLQAFFDERLVFSADLSADMATPPFVMFRLKAGYAGMLELRWQDAAGERFSHQAQLAL